MDPMRIRGVS